MTTKIEWTDLTWNPVRGCSRVSEGCRNCYAEKMAARFSDAGMPYEGLAKRNPARWTGEVRLVEEHLEDPRHWKKPRRVFVNSMSDLFHERLAFEDIDRVCLEMTLAYRHTFQVLTKRPERMLEYVLSVPERATGSGIPTILNIGKAWPPRNIQFGVSVEDQPTFDRRVPVLQQVPAWTRFLSCEPLLGAIKGSKPGLPAICNRPDPEAHGDRWPHVQHIDWVIVGGESGAGARPMHPDWARSIRDQCKAAGVPFFFKQHGEWAECERRGGGHAITMIGHRQRPTKVLYADGRSFDYNSNWDGSDDGIAVERVGKKDAGRLLDGREWSQFPSTTHSA